MNMQERLQQLRDSQRQAAAECEALLNEYDEQGVLRENTALREAAAEQSERLTELDAKCERLANENRSLRGRLVEQIIDEKTNLLRVSQQKLDTYFRSSATSGENRLTALELQVKRRIGELREIAAQQLQEERAECEAELAQWEAALSERIRRRRERLTELAAVQSGERLRRFDELAADGVSEQVIQERIKQNATEMKIGLSWINKIGILLILCGVAAAANYIESTWFNDAMRGAAIFLFGALFVGGGEWLQQRGREAFAKGVLGGGVAILYGGVFYSYFSVHIIGREIALGLAVLITLTTGLMAIRYASRTICCLGLIGGYLPLVSYGGYYSLRGEAGQLAMLYLLLLNLAVLGVAYAKHWPAVNKLSMLLHIPALLYVVWNVDNPLAAMLYTAAAFGANVAAQLAQPLKHAAPFTKSDVLLLGVNTFSSCSILYGLFGAAGWNDYRGALALLFCLLYGGAAKWLETALPDEKHGSLLFYATALTFAVLMIPFQFGVQWMSLGWLVEGVTLVVCGLRRRLATLQKTGWLIFCLCLLAFYLGDWLHVLPFAAKTYFAWRYAAVSVGIAFVAAAALQDSRRGGAICFGWLAQWTNGFAYFAVFNSWIYLLYLADLAYGAWLAPMTNEGFYRAVLLTGVTVGCAYAVPRLPLLESLAVRRIRFGWYLLAVVQCLGINLKLPVVQSLAQLGVAECAAIAVLLLFNLLLAAVVRELLAALVESRRLEFEWYPLGVIVYLLGSATAIVTQQFHLGGGHLASSLVCLLTAAGSLAYGFRKRYSYTRRFGLALAVVSTAKLFIWDLMFLDTPKKIIAYFVFGFVLLGISYLYQRASNELEGAGDA